MKTYQYLNGIMILATFIFLSCGHDNETVVEIDNNTLPLCPNVVKNGFTDKSQTRTNMDDNYVTSFTDGETIGIFAVKEGTILADCNNLKLIYNSTLGTWTGSDIYYYSGAQYYAYAPYNDNMTGKTIDQIITDYPYSADQSTSAKFIENDLLVSSTCTPDPANGTLQINFTHARGLLVFKDITKAHYLYTASSTGDFVYALNNSVLTKITLGGTEHTTGVTANGTLLYIVKPGASPEIVADYEITGTSVLSYTAIEGATNATANTYQKLTLTKNRTLEIGDFFYKDGSFYPGSTTEAAPNQSDCVGVVAYIYQSGDASNYINSWGHTAGYTRGMVVGKTQGNMSSWNNRGTEVPNFTSTTLPLSPEATVGNWHLPEQTELTYLCSGYNRTNQGGEGTTLRTKLDPYLQQAGGNTFGGGTYLSNSGRYGGSTTIQFSNGSFHYDSTQSGRYYVTLAF